jgi:PAS domain-containing protein
MRVAYAYHVMVILRVGVINHVHAHILRVALSTQESRYGKRGFVSRIRTTRHLRHRPTARSRPCVRCAGIHGRRGLLRGHGRSLDDGGNTIGAICAIEDIDARKCAEQALRENEMRFRSTFDNAAAGIAHVGLEGHWLRVNGSARCKT